MHSKPDKQDLPHVLIPSLSHRYVPPFEIPSRRIVVQVQHALSVTTFLSTYHALDQFWTRANMDSIVRSRTSRYE